MRSTNRKPRVPPRWFVVGAWRVHRGIHLGEPFDKATEAFDEESRLFESVAERKQLTDMDFGMVVGASW